MAENSAFSEVPEDKPVVATGISPAKRIFWAVIGVAAAIGLVSTITGGSDSSNEGDETMAKSMCHVQLEKSLKDPDSAKYSDEIALLKSTTGDRSTWSVQGTVRAKNSFGGYVVNTYDCAVIYDRETDLYYAKTTLNE